MKNLIILALVLLIGLQCYAQPQMEPILPYGNHSLAEIKSFILSGTEKANQFKALVFLKTGVNDVDYIFENIIVSRDTTLIAGSYRNSCWDAGKNKIVSYLGKERRCPNGITSYGRIPLWIVDCANIIDAPTVHRAMESDLPYEAEMPQRLRLDSNPPASAKGSGQVNIIINLNLPAAQEKAAAAAAVEEYKPFQELQKKKFKIWKIVVPVGAILAGTATYFLLKNRKSAPPADIGGPVTPPGHDDPGEGGPITPGGH